MKVGDRPAVTPRKPSQVRTCPTCGGEGGFLPARDAHAYDGDPQDLVQWCPRCGGEGVIWEPWEEWEMEWEDPYEALFGHSEERIRELAEWVAAYREARHKARLPPEEATKIASDTVYGPLPF